MTYHIRRRTRYCRHRTFHARCVYRRHNIPHGSLPYIRRRFPYSRHRIVHLSPLALRRPHNILPSTIYRIHLRCRYSHHRIVRQDLPVAPRPRNTPFDMCWCNRRFHQYSRRRKILPSRLALCRLRNIPICNLRRNRHRRCDYRLRIPRLSEIATPHPRIRHPHVFASHRNSTYRVKGLFERNDQYSRRFATPPRSTDIYAN